MDNLEAWTFGGSIITFLVPMIAFSAIVLGLLVLYTKPELVPGRAGKGSRLFPTTATWQPGLPAESGRAETAESASDESASD